MQLQVPLLATRHLLPGPRIRLRPLAATPLLPAGTDELHSPSFSIRIGCDL